MNSIKEMISQESIIGKITVTTAATGATMLIRSKDRPLYKATRPIEPEVPASSPIIRLSSEGNFSARNNARVRRSAPPRI